MRNAVDILHLAKRLGLARVAVQIGALLRNSIRLKTTDFDVCRQTVGASRIGGQPDLPIGFAWPLWRKEPLAFLAQIDLSGMGDLDVDRLLPTKGILYFFWDAYQRTDGLEPTLRDAWRVMFYDGDRSRLRRSTVPANLSEGARYPGYDLEPMQEVTIPPLGSMEMEKLELSDKERNSYIELYHTLSRVDGKRVPIHRMLGHPDAVQSNDMRLDCEILSHGKKWGDFEIRTRKRHNKIRKQLSGAATEWELLFQLDGDEHELPWDVPRMEWGDGGRLFFWIKRGRLLFRRFDEVWFQFQTC